MSRNRFVSPLVLEPAASRYLRIYLLAVHALALYALLLPMLISPGLRMGLIGMLAVSAYVSLRRPRSAAREIQRLRWTSAGHWVLHCRDSRQHSATLLPQSYVSRYLVILWLRGSQDHKYCVPLLADQLPADTFRRLRVRLVQTRLAVSPDSRAE